MPRNVKLINDGTINKNRVQIGELRIYFSYETPIAFYSPPLSHYIPHAQMPQGMPALHS